MMRRLVLLPVLLSLLTSVALASENPAAGSGAVIVLQNTAEHASVDVNSLRRMLLGLIVEWPDGNRVRVALPSRESPAYDTVGRQIFGSSGRGMTRHWLQKVFSGEAQAPSFIDSDAALVAEVLANPNMVGILGARPANIPEGLRLVTP